MKLSELKRGDMFKFTAGEGDIYTKLHIHPDLMLSDRTIKAETKYAYVDVETYGVFASDTDHEIELIPYTNQQNQIMFTAAEAKKLAGQTVQERVESLLVAVRDAATNKRRSLRTGWEYKDDRDLWINGGYSTTKEWKEAKAILEKLGFKVSFYYNEKQFVDMYTLIEW